MINLQKGQKIDLTKTNPGLSKIMVGLGWDPADNAGGGASWAACLVEANPISTAMHPFLCLTRTVSGLNRKTWYITAT